MKDSIAIRSMFRKSQSETELYKKIQGTLSNTVARLMTPES